MPGSDWSDFAAGYGRYQYNFDVKVYQTNVIENYRVVVIYTYSPSRPGGGSTYKFHSTDVRQLDSTLTQFGQWTYHSADTDVWINMIGPSEDSVGYDVQYEITYLHDSWTKTETVTLKSKGVVTVFGDEKTDTNRNNYLNIELKQLVDGDEGAEWEEAGSIKVYPNGNIYWSILHGPEVRLEQQH